jgi:hypothetical protein
MNSKSTESELLIKINGCIPHDLQERYFELIDKRRSETLTPGEYNELLKLTDEVEKRDVKRVEFLKEYKLKAALIETRKDLAKGRFLEESVEDHIHRITQR